MWKIFKKTLKEKRLLVFSLCVISLLMILMYCSLFPFVEKQTEAMQTVLSQYPKELWQAMGISSGSLDLSSFTQYITLELFTFMWPILIMILTTNMAMNAIAGEIDKGTLKILLSQPVSRFQIFFAKYFAGVTYITIFTAISTLSIIGFAKLFNIEVVELTYVKLFVTALGLALSFFAISNLFGVVLSKASATTITIGMAFGMYLLNVLSDLSENLTKLRYASLFHYFGVNDLLSTNELSINHLIVFAVIIVVATILAIWYFNKRDITF